MKRSSLTILAVAIAGMSSVQANLVVDGGFEIAPVPGSFTTKAGGTLGAWAVTAGSVDLIGGYWQPAGGSESLDAAGLQKGTISQSINIPTAGNYLLTFAMSGNPDGPPALKELLVNFGAWNQTFSYNIATEGNTKANMKWKTMSGLVYVPAGGLYTLSFQDISAPAAGWNGTTLGAPHSMKSRYRRSPSQRRWLLARCCCCLSARARCAGGEEFSSFKSAEPKCGSAGALHQGRSDQSGPVYLVAAGFETFFITIAELDVCGQKALYHVPNGIAAGM